MSWELGNFIDGVKAFAEGKKVKMYNPETEATVSMDELLADLGGCVAFIEENKPVEASDGQKPETVEQAASSL